MKRVISLILAVVLICSFAVITNASDDITVYLDGVEIQFDVKPQIIGGRTMVPIRAIFEKMGASVEWNSATATATAKRGTTTVVMAVGDKNVCVNNVCSAMDVAPTVIGGRTLAPARYVAEAFGGTVAWNSQTRRVDITSSKPVTMYALDGRTISVYADETQAYKNVGWYYSPVTTMYATDGRTIVVAKSEVENYIKVGWYKSYEDAKYAKLSANFKVGVIHVWNPFVGPGYSYSHDLGIIDMQKNLNLRDEQIIRKININDADKNATKKAMEECIAQGCKIIFGTSWGYMDAMEELAKKYPDVIFSHATGFKSNYFNFNNYYGRIYQAHYLTGIAAGLKTKTNKIGYVAAMDKYNAEVTSGLNAFAMGVKSVNPDAKVYVKVTYSWSDRDLEYQAAQTLIDKGCDVIGQHSDTSAPQLAAERRGVWGCGYNSDMTKDAPKAHLTAPVFNYGVYYTKAAKAVIENNWVNENYYGSINDGFIDISPLSENCAEGTAEAIEAAKTRIANGFKIFEGEIKDNRGNIVCRNGEYISDADIIGDMNWYFETIVEE